MASEDILRCSVASFAEDVLQQHGKSLSDIDLASRKAEEASLRRNEATRWLRKMVGVVAGKDLPAEPSEEDFRLGLRSGIILCNVLNKVQPGAVPKVVEPPDSAVIPDGAALSAYQYFENVRNFLAAVENMGLPTFEASDLEKGGKSSRILNCVLALKSYHEWKLAGGNGLWKYGGNQKPFSSVKQFVRKNSELFMNSISRNSLTSEKSLDSLSGEESACGDYRHGDSSSLNKLVHELLMDKKQEDIPVIVEKMLSKIMEEFEQQLACQKEQLKSTSSKTTVLELVKSPTEVAPQRANMEHEPKSKEVGEVCHEDIQSSQLKGLAEHTQNNQSKGLANEIQNSQSKGLAKDIQNSQSKGLAKDIQNSQSKGLAKDIQNSQSKELAMRQQMLVERHQKDIQELKNIVHTAKADMHVLRMKYQEEVKSLGKHLHGLANTASGYQKVLEENRKLYNQVQDLKGNIRVYCRVRPFLPGQPNGLSTVLQIDEGNITITTPSKSGKDGRKTFTFNKVFGPSATQGEVFADTQPLIRSVLDGYNVCIFAYGQTGSGKTYTMSGPNDLTEESMGVNYRALNDLFLISEQRKNIVSYDVSVQMMEIYNEQVRDLLANDGGNKRLEIRNSSQKGINVPDANTVPVTSTSDVINLMNLGHKNRAVSSTAMNDRSSRSHSCLTVHVQGRDIASGSILRGCMHLVDLAGSERVDKSEVVGERLKEAQHINKSLSALGDVIASLAQKNTHVPYRNSKLTQLLQDSLGGQAKTLMFVHMSPEPDAIGETISTLKFAERVSTVELGAARANKESSEIRELKEQIATLKAALVRKEGESGTLQHSVSMSPQRFRMKSSASSSPSHYSWQYSEGAMDDVDSIQVVGNSTANTKRQSLDPQDFLISSPPWPSIGSPGPKDDERDLASGDWVDKVMLNKHDARKRDHSQGRLEEDSRQSPQMFYQKCSLDASKVHPEQRTNKVLDDSDELDVATCDSSEADFLWQTNIPRFSGPVNTPGSKTKRPSSKLAKSPDLRSSIPTPQTRRLSTGTNSPLQKTGRHPVSANGKRKPGSVK